jgi:hypothetical protein
MQISVTFLENVILSILQKRSFRGYSFVIPKDTYIIISSIERQNIDYYKFTFENGDYCFLNHSNFVVEYLSGEYDI